MLEVSAPERPLWHKWIAPATILDQVRNTAPFLFDARFPAYPFVEILRRPPLDETAARDEQLFSYYSLCLAAHQATVATFVPTDVDSKIRGLLWLETRDPDLLRRMLTLALQMRAWPLAGISTRWDEIDHSGPVSGHNGEWLSVMAGALGRFLQLGLADLAAEASAAVDAELEREAHAFRLALPRKGHEILTLRLAMSITHNLGDLDQGIGYWEGAAKHSPEKTRFSRLAHENRSPYQGTFQLAARLYREAMAAEGHRHYPLRGVKPLRRSPDLLLPLGPFLDDWGATVAQHPALATADRAEVLEALFLGCKKVPNQHGYFRALAGFHAAHPGEFDRAAAMLPHTAQKLARDPNLRKAIAIPRVSFESAYRKKVETLRRAT